MGRMRRHVVCSSIAAGFDGLITHELAHKLASWRTNTTAMSATAATTIAPTAGGDPWEVNITNNTDRATTKWHDLIQATTAIPTTSDTPPGVVGLWEGGGYYRNGHLSSAKYLSHAADRRSLLRRLRS